MTVIFRGQRRPDESGFRFRVMSTFSGIGAASISWDEAQYEFVAYAEPAAFPAHVLHYRRGAGRPRYLPDPQQVGISDDLREQRQFDQDHVTQLPEEGVVNWGDITQITDDDLATLGKVHVLEGGSPCQAFSIAGARNGLDDPRGNLLLTFCQLAERMREINGLEFVVWENVQGVLSEKTNGFGYLLASLAGETGGPLERPGKKWSNAGRVFGPNKRQVAWRTVDAVHWGIPQRRKRVFVIANIGGTFRGFGVPDQILFESESSVWNLSQGLKTRQAVVSTYRRGDRFEYRSAEERFREPAVVARLDAEATKSWIGHGLPTEGVVANLRQPSRDKQHARGPSTISKLHGLAQPVTKTGPIVVGTQTAGTLYARAAQPAGISSEHNFLVITKETEDEPPENWIVRRFTPLECERLQGFPDHWTDVPFCGELVTDGHRYKALGNSMPCPVMSFIGNVLEAHMDIQHFAEENLDIFRRKRGRPPKGERPMSAKERQRRRRERIRGEAGLLLKEKSVLDHETKTQLLSRVQQIRRLILGEPTPDLLIQLDLLEDLIDKLGPSLSQHT